MIYVRKMFIHYVSGSISLPIIWSALSGEMHYAFRGGINLFSFSKTGNETTEYVNTHPYSMKDKGTASGRMDGHQMARDATWKESSYECNNELNAMV